MPLALTTPTAPAAQPPVPVRLGTTVTPDTVTVGDPFVVQVRVAAPAGATVTFPSAPDSASAVALLQPVREARAATPDGGVDVTASYRVAAWDVGAVPLGLGEAVVRLGTAERRVPLGGLRVTVRSVLPPDSARRVPKPVREPLPDTGLWWLPWLLALLAVAALVAVLAWWARRRLRARRAAVTADQAYRAAVAAFDQLDRLQLVAAGEGGRHLALSADIARDYLAARVPEADRARTSGELVAALDGNPDVPLDRLTGLLADADLVKFAGARVAPAVAHEGGQAARALVDDVEAAVRTRLAREAAERAAAEQAARAAQRQYEQERRRAARRNGAAPNDAGPDAGARDDADPPSRRAA